ncbi:MAG: Peptidoglycan O-acetyltransferase [Anaerolineales bacterium]|nr:Peptidoglycan O-acetyltransferase [Anaerolineales bacterium]
MNFTSYEFLLFFLIVLAAYWLVRKQAWQNLLLLAASYVFYGWIHPWYALLLGLSTLGDYWISLSLEKTEKKSRLVWASLILNVGVLAFFKYFKFFVPTLADKLAAQGIHADAFLASVILPIGLSFFTLKKLAYILDVSRGVVRPTRDLVGFALFVAFFPQITAGPIDRAQKLLPQIQSPRVWKADNFYNAWPLLVMGFFKKFVVANGVGPTVSRILHLTNPTGELAVAAALGFTLQVLADFSGYTDIARGLSFLLGFETSENFRNPYLSLTPTEFWNRWHITLSTWLRDYIFFPLRRYLLRNHPNLPNWTMQSIPPIVTMFISGLWHGAGWTYLVWGTAYGVLIALYQLLGLRGEWKPSNPLARLGAWTVMFSLISFLFLIFAAPSLGWVAGLFSSPFLGTVEQQSVALLMFSLTAAFSAPLILKLLLDRYFKPDSLVIALYYAAATMLMFIYINSGTPDFIYFQF